MKRFLSLTLAMLVMMASSAWAQPYTNLSSYPSFTLGRQYPVPIDMPVYVTNNFVTMANNAGITDVSKAVQVGLQKVNNGNLYRYYYAGTTSSTSCSSSHSVIGAYGIDPNYSVSSCGVFGSCNVCPNGNFGTLMGSSWSQQSAQGMSSGIAGMVFFALSNGASYSTSALQTANGGVVMRPLLANPASGSSVGQQVSVPAGSRTLGYSPFSCVTMSGLDAYLCLERSPVNGRLRFTRTSFSSPGTTTTTCATSTSVNCGTFVNSSVNNTSHIGKPLLAVDTTRNVLWATDYATEIYTSSDNGTTWTLLSNPFASAAPYQYRFIVAMAYNGAFDSMIFVTEDGGGSGPDTYMRTANTTVSNPPVLVGKFFAADKVTSMNGSPQTVSVALDHHLDCSRTTYSRLFGGTPLYPVCTYIFTDNTQDRNLRRLRFAPGYDRDTTAAVYTIAWVVGNDVLDDGTTLPKAASGIAWEDCTIFGGSLCDSVWISNDQDPALRWPMSYAKQTAPTWNNLWADWQFPYQQNSVLIVQPSGVEAVWRHATSQRYLISRHDAWEL